MRDKGKSGMSMIEAVIGLLILSLVSVAVTTLILSVLSLTNSSRLKNQSTTYAEQFIEQVRDYFQADGWSRLSDFGKNAPRCFISLWTEPYPYPGGGQTCENDRQNPQCNLAETALTGVPNFYRYLIVTTSGTSFVQVFSVVTWRDKGICKKTQVDTYFYNY